MTRSYAPRLTVGQRYEQKEVSIDESPETAEEGIWLSALLIAALPSLAQQNTGTILGTILDPSGAVIPGATVLVENQGTGHALKLTTNSTGNFFAPELPVGVYSVSVSHTGFRTEVRKNIALAVSDRLRLTITLQP